MKENTEQHRLRGETPLTSIYRGAEAVTELRIKTLSGARSRLDICDDSVGTVALVQFQPVRNALVTAARHHGVHVRFITDIRQENLASCKELLEFVELRHLANVKGNFAVTDKEYYAFAEIKEAKIPVQAIYSQANVIVEQQQYVFDTLWDSAMPAALKIRELEQGVAPFETRIVRGRKEIETLAYAMIERSLGSHLYIATDDRETEDEEAALKYVRGLLSKNPNFEFLILVDLQKNNLDYYKVLIKEGVQIRHIERNRVVFLLSKEEFLGGEFRGSSEEGEVTWANDPKVVAQMHQIFHTMWRSGIPGEARIRQLEEGVEPQETRLIEDMREVLRMGAKLTRELRFECLIIASIDNMLLRNREMFQEISRRQQRDGIKARILAPMQDQRVFDVLPAAEWRRIDPTSVSVMIFDRKAMFITQYADSSAETTEMAVASNIYSTNNQTILGMVSVFEALWRESELRDSEARARSQLVETLQLEERTRKQAQLLQDILTHDIRNHNQVSKLSAELLREKYSDDPEALSLIDSLLESIDGSTMLVEKGRKLGKILSEEHASLAPINLVEQIQRALTLVRQGNKGKVITEKALLPEGLKASEIQVQADELLEEVFSNVFSNSVKYTEGTDVRLTIKIEDAGSFWKIALSDQGSGIPPEVLPKVFDRYLAGARGSGLGMSIVHALTVHRYGGKVEVTSSQKPGASGTTIYIWLRKSPAT